MGTHPRARACVNSIQLGAKMGASVGGCFGFLTGIWVSWTQRNPFILPVSVIGGSISFGFFLGCGMIIRCDEKKNEGCEFVRYGIVPPPPAMAIAAAAISTPCRRIGATFTE